MLAMDLDQHLAQRRHGPQSRITVSKRDPVVGSGGMAAINCALSVQGSESVSRLGMNTFQSSNIPILNPVDVPDAPLVANNVL